MSKLRLFLTSHNDGTVLSFHIFIFVCYGSVISLSYTMRKGVVGVYANSKDPDQSTGPFLFIKKTNTVELQWLEPLWDHENLFETAVVRALEGYY